MPARRKNPVPSLRRRLSAIAARAKHGNYAHLGRNHHGSHAIYAEVDVPGTGGHKLIFSFPRPVLLTAAERLALWRAFCRAGQETLTVDQLPPAMRQRLGL